MNNAEKREIGIEKMTLKFIEVWQLKTYVLSSNTNPTSTIQKNRYKKFCNAQNLNNSSNHYLSQPKFLFYPSTPLKQHLKATLLSLLENT